MKKFKEKDIPVTYSTITSGADQTAALASGDIQFLNCVGGSSVLLSAANGADIKIISLYSQAPKAFKLFSKDAATSPQSLKGKTIAGPKGTILHELLAAYLKQGGLSIEDNQICVSMGLPASRAALETAVPTVPFWPAPWLIRKNRKACMLLQLVTALFQVLQSRQRAGSSIKEHKELVDLFLSVQKETLTYMKDHQKEALAAAVKATGLDEKAVDSMYGLYDFSMEITPEAIESLKKTQDFLVSSSLWIRKSMLMTFLSNNCTE